MALMERLRNSFRRDCASPITDGVEPFEDSERWAALVAEVNLDARTKSVTLPAEIEHEIERVLESDPDVRRRRERIASR